MVLLEHRQALRHRGDPAFLRHLRVDAYPRPQTHLGVRGHRRIRLDAVLHCHQAVEHLWGAVHAVGHLGPSDDLELLQPDDLRLEVEGWGDLSPSAMVQQAVAE